MLYVANRYQLLLVDKHTSNEDFGFVVRYWQAIRDAGLLKYRLADVEDPGISDVVEMIMEPRNMCFVVFDPVRQMLCADAMLNNFMGKVAQVHFSIHPEYKGTEGVLIARSGVEQLFATEIKLTNDRIETLIGLTPKNNPLALRFIRKVGFKVFDIIEDLFYTRYSKSYSDGCLSKLNVGDMYGR